MTRTRARKCRMSLERARLNAQSRLEVLELVEMRIIMRNIDAVYLRAGKHEYVEPRNRDPTCAATICKADSTLPNFGGNLVIRQHALIRPKSLPLGVIRHATPELKSHRRTPCGVTDG